MVRSGYFDLEKPPKDKIKAIEIKKNNH